MSAETQGVQQTGGDSEVEELNAEVGLYVAQQEPLSVDLRDAKDREVLADVDCYARINVHEMRGVEKKRSDHPSGGRLE
jgi:hypothetical protein